MTTIEFKDKAQVLFGKLNNVYRELGKLYDFYDVEVWGMFKKIDSYYAEETIERLASIVPGMDENSLRCFKLIFDWIEETKNLVRPIDPENTLPEKIEAGKRYRIISHTRIWYELYIGDELDNMDLSAPLHMLEKVVREWDEFVRIQKQQVDLLCYRLEM